MKRLLMLFVRGAILLLSVAPVAAQNSVDVLNNGPQPANTTGCAVNPNCIPATWSTTSNAGADITTAISANFVFDSNGGALPNDFPSATSVQICLAEGAGQAVEPSMNVDSQGTIYVESIRGVPGGLDLWRWNKAADGGPNANGTLPFKYEGQPDCGSFVTTFCTASGVAPGGGDGDVAANSADPFNLNIPNLAVVSLAAAEVTGSHSTDRADTFSTPNPATAGVPFDDR